MTEKSTNPGPFNSFEGTLEDYSAKLVDFWRKLNNPVLNEVEVLSVSDQANINKLQGRDT